MQEFLTAQYNARILRWAEPTEDGELYEVVMDGRVLRADSVALIFSAVQDLAQRALVLGSRPTLTLAWAA